MAEKVLFVDDEENVLNSIERLFADSDIRILRTTSPHEAMKILKKEDISVIVTDNLMPGMKGIDLLVKTKKISPDTVKILMTAYADLSTAIEAINTSEIYRFIVKPWENDAFIEIVEEGINRYRLIQTLKNCDEAILLSLAQTIELKDPYTRGHCDRVARYALTISDSLNLPEDKKKEIKHGSWLHDCGKIGIPEGILKHKGPLSDEEIEIIKKHPLWGAEVAKKAQLSVVIVNVILYHHERFDGKGYPHGIKGNDIPLEARIVSVADVYDALITDRPYRNRYSLKKAADIILSLKGKAFDPEIVGVFSNVIKEIQNE